ncbi:MAG: hypothetical protein M1835_000553 [Candelina submexicana]|nr:MAG: hypothetical protein M1835_000553 [Candelina submexicana]
MSRLEGLPAEIRDLIYRYALTSEHELPHRNPNIASGLFLTCRSISEESRHVFYAYNTFRFVLDSPFDAQLSSTTLLTIRKVKVNWWFEGAQWDSGASTGDPPNLNLVRSSMLLRLPKLTGLTQLTVDCGALDSYAEVQWILPLAVSRLKCLKLLDLSGGHIEGDLRMEMIPALAERLGSRWNLSDGQCRTRVPKWQWVQFRESEDKGKGDAEDTGEVERAISDQR